jgi:hypothetical protein
VLRGADDEQCGAVGLGRLVQAAGRAEALKLAELRGNALREELGLELLERFAGTAGQRLVSGPSRSRRCRRRSVARP